MEPITEARLTKGHGSAPSPAVTPSAPSCSALARVAPQESLSDWDVCLVTSEDPGSVEGNRRA